MMARRRKPSVKQGIKPSNRYLKTQRKFKRVSAKIRKTNDNRNHHVSKQIADDFDTVYIEDLNRQGMTKSAKGTIDEPGRSVKAKSELNKPILKIGWYKLEQALSYKSNVIKVSPQYTSQTCNKCGNAHKDNRITPPDFVCQACGHSDNADINAAKNILAFGIGESLNGRGDSGASLSVKSQKAHNCQ